MANFRSGASKQVIASNSETPKLPATLPEDNEVTTVPNLEVDGDALAEHAFRLAAKESKQMANVFETLAKAREDWQGGPIMTLLALRSTYSKEELDEFAVPGSETGNNPDKFKITVTNGDKKTTRNTTFYAQFARGTTSGKKLVERMEWLERAADKGAIKEGIPEDILSMSPEQRTSHMSWCTGRLNTMTQSYKKAMQLHFKLNEVNEYDAAISADPIWMEGYSPDDVNDLWEAKVEATNEPLAVMMNQGPNKPPRWEPFSIGAFLKLNPKRAAENGGGFKRLIESGATKKAPAAPGTAPAATPDVTIKTVDRGIGVMVEFHRWLLEIASETDGANYGKLVQDLTKKGNDEYVVSAVELKNYLVDLCKNNGLDLKYIKLKQSGSELVHKAEQAA